MCRIQLGVILDLALQIHLSEHLQSRLFPCASYARSSFGLHCARHLPALLAAFKSERLTIVASCNNLGLAIPDQRCEREQQSRDVDHGSGRLFWTTGIDDCYTAVVRREGQGVAAGREYNGMDPACRVIEIFAANCVERKTLAPDGGLRSFVNTLDEAGEDAGMGVCRSGREKNRVRMPIKSGDCALDRLLEVLGDPPVVLLLEIADCDHSGTRTNSKLLLGG